MDEEEAPSHLNNKDEEEEAAVDPSSSQMSMDEQRDLSKEEDDDEHLMEEEEQADESPSHPMTKEEQEEEDERERWEAYLDSQWSRNAFAQYYRCRPMALLGRDTAADYDDGNRVVMPQSALERLSTMKVEYPMVFRIENAATLQASHVGVQEFVADEGFIHIPTHTMSRLGLLHGGENNGGPLVLLTSTSLPKATSVKLQPHTTDFLGVKYPKELLEYNFGKYTCMTVGDTITVIEGERRYLLDVVEAKPADAVSTIETDCEVAFLPPLDYVEPTRVLVPTRAPVKVATCQGDGEERFSDIVGVRMDGKPVEQSTPANVANGQGKGRFSHVGVQMDSKPVEHAPMVSATSPLAKGDNNKSVLRFGAGASIASASKAGKKPNTSEKANPFTGKKYSLED